MTRAAALLSRRLSSLVESRTDGELLSAFVADRDEAAFADLVRRHGRLVWGACRRLLPDPADAEDAFQASFLVLVRRARRLTGAATVGPWLYRVAVWTARNLRRRNARHLARRVPLSPAEPDRSPEVALGDLRADLDAALLALPEKYRTPLVLCHLQGWSRRDAAAEIGCPEGTLSALLSRGLDRLRAQLRSHDPVKLLAVGGTAVPAVLVSNTVKAAVAGQVAAAGLVTTSIHQLAEGVIQMFWVKKATAAAVGLAVVFGAGLGVGVGVKPVPAGADDGPAVAATAKRGLFEADPPAGRAVPAAEVEALKVELDSLRAELAAAEEVLTAALRGVELTRRKLDLTKAGVDKGSVAAGEYLDAQIALTRLEENAANAKLRKATVLGKLTGTENKLKTWTAQPKPAAKPTAAAPPATPAKADGPTAVEWFNERMKPDVDLEQQLEVLIAEVAQTQKRADTAQAEAAQLADRRKLLVAKIAELRALQAERAAKVKPAAPAAGGVSYLFHLTVTGDARWPFQVKEYAGDGQGVGTAAFDNTAALTRYLGRVVKEPGARPGVGVRVIVPKDTPWERSKAVLDACKAAGVKEITMSAAEKPAAAGPVESLKADDTKLADVARELLSQQRLDMFKERAAAEAARQQEAEQLYKQRIELLTRQVEQLEKLKKAQDLKPLVLPAEPVKKSDPAKP